MIPNQWYAILPSKAVKTNQIVGVKRLNLELALFRTDKFVPDKKKTGGAYVSVSGTVKKIDDYERAVILCEGTSIPIDDIFHINGKLFDGIEAG